MHEYHGNDDPTAAGSPVARGMAIETKTGRVFLVNSVPSHLAGAAFEVRSARIFSSFPEERLQVIHHSTSNGHLCIEPFEYHHYQEMEILMAQLPDETLLQLASASPQVEREEFCGSIRSTLAFIKRVPSCHVFCQCDEPLVYQRQRRKSSNALNNEWALCNSRT